MKSFNVIWWDFNKKDPEPYDIIPALIDRYNQEKHKPQTFEGFRDFIIHYSRYQWWSRCQYEIIIKRWPPTEESRKWDIHQQIMMNIDIITEILMKSIEELNGNCTEKISK